MEVKLFSFIEIVVASKTNADTFFALSTMGEVMCHTIRSAVFEEIVVHKFDDAAAQEVETAILSRNLQDAYTRTIEISRNQREPGELSAKYERELIDLCTARKPIAADSWKRASTSNSSHAVLSELEMLSAFKKDLDQYSYYLPPHYEELTQWSKDISPVIRLDYDLIVFRAKLIEFVKAEDWYSITKLEA